MSAIYKSTHTGQEIDNAVTKVDTLVSVEANPSTVGETNLENLKVGDTVYKIPEQITPTVVKANPSADATTDLTKLQVGTTVYGIPEGGGTEVVANPTETGTTDLASLKVGDTVYNVPSGGGGNNIDTSSMFTISIQERSLAFVDLFGVVINNVYYPKVRVANNLSIIPEDTPVHFTMAHIYDAWTLATVTGSFVDTSGATVDKTTIANKLVIPTENVSMRFEI